MENCGSAVKGRGYQCETGRDSTEARLEVTDMVPSSYNCT